jgi:opacity protein-like surface antigen
MMTFSPARALAIVVCVLTSAATTQVAAQAPTVPASGSQSASRTTVRTTRDRVVVWGRNPSQVIATLPAGVELEAIGRDAQWYQVRVPEKFAGAGGAIGFVFQGHVERVSGPEPPMLPPGTSRVATTAGRPAGPPPPPFRARAYASGAYEWFLAKDAFKAILDQRAGFFYGGGGQVIFRRLFVDAGFEQFKKTGQRAIVVDGVVFPLGIADTITMQPFRVTGGYRFKDNRGTTAYVGGGVGSLHFQEVSKFAAAGENTDERFTSYNVVAGAEYTATKFLFVAAEFRYEGVPNAIGAPGIAGDFKEDNLGGFGVAVKVLVGR